MGGASHALMRSHMRRGPGLPKCGAQLSLSGRRGGVSAFPTGTQVRLVFLVRAWRSWWLERRESAEARSGRRELVFLGVNWRTSVWVGVTTFVFIPPLISAHDSQLEAIIRPCSPSQERKNGAQASRSHGEVGVWPTYWDVAPGPLSLPLLPAAVEEGAKAQGGLPTQGSVRRRGQGGVGRGG